jgi:hypothetical protein
MTPPIAYISRIGGNEKASERRVSMQTVSNTTTSATERKPSRALIGISDFIYLIILHHFNSIVRPTGRPSRQRS